MKEIKTDLRYVKTKEGIHKAFRELLQEMEYGKITVKLLAERARINRKTFYVHYDTMEELLNELSNEIVKSCVEQIQQYYIPSDLRQIIDTVFRYWQSLTSEDVKIFRTASASPQCLVFSQCMRDTFKNFDPGFCGDDPKKQTAALVFMVNAMGSLSREWTVYSAADSLEEAVDLTYELIFSGLSGQEKRGDTQ